jgi:hypothetical protein
MALKIHPNTAKAVLAKRLAQQPHNLPVVAIALDPNFPKQNAFIEDPAQFIDAQCSRRAGKSSGLAIRFFRTMAKFPGATCIYLALTKDSARDIMWPIIEELNEKHGLGFRLSETRLTVTHPNGAKLQLYGADQKNFIKRLRGKKSPGIAIDEAQDFGTHLQVLIDDIVTPMMIDFGQEAWLAITGTPGPVPNGTFFEITEQKKQGYSHHSWVVNDNPYVPDPEIFIQSLIKKRGWDANHPTLLREWRNKWVLDLESLWVRYKSTINDFVDLPPQFKSWQYILAIDIGFKDSDALAVLAFCDNDPCTYLIEEVITEKQDITALVAQIKALQANYVFSKITMDAGALGKKIMEEIIVRHQIHIEAADKTRKQENIELLNDALRLGRFKARKNSRFAQDSYLIQIDWDKCTPDKIVIKKTPHSDIIDAVLYGFKLSPAYYYEGPKNKASIGTKEYDAAQAQMLLDHHIEKLQKAKDQKENPGMNWETDAQGIPPWLKYQE